MTATRSPDFFPACGSHHPLSPLCRAVVRSTCELLRVTDPASALLLPSLRGCVWRAQNGASNTVNAVSNCELLPCT